MSPTHSTKVAKQQTRCSKTPNRDKLWRERDDARRAAWPLTAWLLKALSLISFPFPANWQRPTPDSSAEDNGSFQQGNTTSQNQLALSPRKCPTRAQIHEWTNLVAKGEIAAKKESTSAKWLTGVLSQERSLSN